MNSIYNKDITRRHLLFLLLLLGGCSPMFSQTVKVRGVIREITHNSTDPIVPINGARVIISGISSAKTNNEGRFSISLPSQKDKSFCLQDIRFPEGSNYLLATPARNERIYYSANDLQISLITQEQKDKVSKATYNKLFRQYRKQGNMLQQQRNELEEMQLELDESDAQYQQLAVKIDSLQRLLNDYFDSKNKTTVTQTLEKVAEELTMTDYQSLDSIDTRIYNLKKAGDWSSLSQLLNEVMHGNVAAYLQEGVQNKKAAQTVLDAANKDLSIRFKRMEEAIHAFKMQYQNDSISKYYRILVEADSTRIDYLLEAGDHECRNMGNYDLGILYYQKVLQLADTDKMKAKAYNSIGRAHLFRMHFPEALEMHQKALDLLKKYYKEDDPEMAETYHNIGAIYNYKKEPEKAIRYLKQALKIKQKQLGDDHPDLVMYYYTLSIAYNNLGKEEECKKALLHCKNILTKEQDFEHPHLPYIYNGLGICYRKEGNFAEAESNLKMALESWIKICGQYHLLTYSAHSNLGTLYLKNGKFDEAKTHLLQALKICKKIYKEENPYTANAYDGLGSFYEETGNLTEALNYYRMELTILKKTFGEKDGQVVELQKYISELEKKKE